MRILIIAYYYFPHVAPRASRWTALAEQFAKIGHQVDVVCAKTSTKPLSAVKGNVRVHYTEGGVFEAIRLKVQESQKRVGEIPVEKRRGRQGLKGIKSMLGRTIQKAYNLTWKKTYWPDFACLWFFKAFKTAQSLLKQNDFDCLISVSHPFTGHVVGRYLQKKYKVPYWLVDIGDPFCFVETTPLNNAKLYRKLNTQFERSVFNEANGISVTTAGTAKIYTDLFPESGSKIHVIPPVYTLKGPLKSGALSIKTGPSPIILLFIGTLYKSIRSPQFLLEIFDALRIKSSEDRVELHFIGPVNDCLDVFAPYEHHIGKSVFLHGEVARESVASVLDQADVLINIGNLTSYQLPSKLVEYVSLGKPVLNLYKVPDDASLLFLKGYPAVLNIMESLDRIEAADALKTFIQSCGEMNKEDFTPWKEPYTIEKITGKYLDLIVGQ